MRSTTIFTTPKPSDDLLLLSLCGFGVPHGFPSGGAERIGKTILKTRIGSVKKVDV
jgi:hypothetical protein